MQRNYDTVIYLDEAGKPKVAEVIVAVGPDGQPTGSVQIKSRQVHIYNGVTVAGTDMALPGDELRTGLTIRNDSDAMMYFHLGQDAGDGIGYPMDARRGYSFEALGMIPMADIHIWCGSAGNRYAIMYSSSTDA